MDEREETFDLLVDEVFNNIRQKIMTRQYAPGEKLTARKLCEEYAVSETPVKQALNRLVILGLVESQAHKGMRVRQFAFPELKDMFEARMMIELFCMDSAIERVKRDEDFVRRIKKILDDSDQAINIYINDRSVDNFNINSIKDNALHSAYVECCKNRQIISTYESLNTHLAMYIGIEGHTAERMKVVQKEHADIAQAFLLCDRDSAKKYIEKHIFGTINLFREVLNG